VPHIEYSNIPPVGIASILPAIDANMENGMRSDLVYPEIPNTTAAGGKSLTPESVRRKKRVVV